MKRSKRAHPFPCTRVSIRARKCERMSANTNNGELFIRGCCKKCEQCSHLFKKKKLRTKFTFSQYIEEFYSWLNANKSHLIGCLTVRIHCRTGPLAACPTAVLSHCAMPSIFVTSVCQDVPYVCPSRPSIMSVRPCVCLSAPLWRG